MSNPFPSSIRRIAVGRTLLSAAFDVGVAPDLFLTQELSSSKTDR